MISDELRDQFRSDVVDTVQPHLWADEEIFRYIDDAQKMFCRRVGGLADVSTPGVTQLPVVTTTDWVDISPLILKFRAANFVADGSKVEITNFEDLAEKGIRFDGSKGRVKALVIGMEEGRARLWPYPDQVDIIQLMVDRLPLKHITDEGQKLEIAEQHHLHLLHWVKHLAYSKQDAETRDDKKAAEYEIRFYSYCAEAKAEKERAKHKTRVVTYGGI